MATAEVSAGEQQLESITGTLPGYHLPVPVPLQQLNLKLPPAVLAIWRAQAAADGLSVRDWLIRITGAPTAPPVPAAEPGLTERVAALEAALADLGAQVAALVPLPSPPVKAAAPEAEAVEAAAPASSPRRNRRGNGRGFGR